MVRRIGDLKARKYRVFKSLREKCRRNCAVPAILLTDFRSPVKCRCSCWTLELSISMASRVTHSQRYWPATARRGDGTAAYHRAIWRVAAACARHLLAAMHESRRRQASLVISRHRNFIAPEAWGQAPSLPTPRELVGGTEKATSWEERATEGGKFLIGLHQRMNCPLTNAPCEGDLAHLCEDWGCARKGGLSPLSHENY